MKLSERMFGLVDICGGDGVMIRGWAWEVDQLESTNASLLEALQEAYGALLPNWEDNLDICAKIDATIRKAEEK
jgi:hypothetical protein